MQPTKRKTDNQPPKTMKKLALFAFAAAVAALSSGCVTRINIVPVKVNAPNVWDSSSVR